MDVRRILVAVDIAHFPEPLAEYARILAEKLGARLNVLYVTRDVEELESLYVPHISVERVQEEIIDSASSELSSFCNTHFGGRAEYEVVIHTGNASREIKDIILNWMWSLSSWKPMVRKGLVVSFSAVRRSGCSGALPVPF